MWCYTELLPFLVSPQVSSRNTMFGYDAEFAFQYIHTTHLFQWEQHFERTNSAFCPFIIQRRFSCQSKRRAPLKNQVCELAFSPWTYDPQCFLFCLIVSIIQALGPQPNFFQSHGRTFDNVRQSSQAPQQTVVTQRHRCASFYSPVPQKERETVSATSGGDGAHGCVPLWFAAIVEEEQEVLPS